MIMTTEMKTTSKPGKRGGSSSSLVRQFFNAVLLILFTEMGILYSKMKE